jgi:hypothetical protein
MTGRGFRIQKHVGAGGHGVAGTVVMCSRVDAARCANMWTCAITGHAAGRGEYEPPARACGSEMAGGRVSGVDAIVVGGFVTGPAIVIAVLG